MDKRWNKRWRAWIKMMRSDSNGIQVKSHTNLCVPPLCIKPFYLWLIIKSYYSPVCSLELALGFPEQCLTWKEEVVVCLAHKRIKFLCNPSYHVGDHKGFPGEVDHAPQNRLTSRQLARLNFIQFKSVNPALKRYLHTLTNTQSN